MTLAERLQRLLAREGHSIAAVGELAGMSRQQVWKIVKGHMKNPGIETVRRIVEAAGGTMAELLADEDD